MKTIKEEVYVSKKTKRIYLANETKIFLDNPIERDLSKYKKFGENNAFEFWRVIK